MKFDQTLHTNLATLSSRRKSVKTINNAYIIDKHPLIFDGYLKLFKSIENSIKSHQCFNLDDISSLNIINSEKNVIVIDIFNISKNSLQTLIDIRTSYPKTKIIIYTTSQDTHIIERCMSLGASGYIPKNTSIKCLSIAIKAIAIGIKWTPKNLSNNSNDEFNSFNHFTEKELLTLRHLVTGMVNRDIARNMNVTESTTKSHVSSIFKKLGVYNRTQVFCEFKKINQQSLQKYRA